MNVVNIEEKLDSKRIKNEYEAVLESFFSIQNQIIKVMFPESIDNVIFPYDKDLTDKLSLTDGKLDSADITRTLYF